MSGAGRPGRPCAAARTAAALARAILRLYPRSFRRQLGDAMVQDIRRQAEERQREGAWAAWRGVPPIVVSLLVNAFAERREGIGRGGRLGRGRPFGMAAQLSPLDFKLGARMMARHPGLTLMGILGIAVAIVMGAVFASAAGIVYAELPFDGGDRFVAIENWDLEINNQDYRNLYDYLIWRDEVETLDDLGAYRTVRRNLIGPDGHTEPVILAETTAATFRLPAVPPLLGRALVEADMRADADPVVVIGHRIWRTRFGADVDIVGSELRVGATAFTVVGVMPEGFAFPLFHEAWVPLHIDPVAYGPREGPNVDVFGHLAEGATLEAAQAELTAIGRRLTQAHPETHEHIRARVIRYTELPFDDMDGFEVPALGVLIVLLLVVIAANVATLIYARTAGRREELLVRAALGASRQRLVGQLFVEALLVAGTAAALGLAVTVPVLARLNAIIEELAGRWSPFWMRFSLTPGTIAWVMLLALLAAVVSGVLPALGATGRKVQAGLQGNSGGTVGDMGRTWTVLIVAQVAFAVAVLPTTVFVGWEMTRYGTADPGFDAERYAAGFLNVDSGDAVSTGVVGGVGDGTRGGADDAESRARYVAMQRELSRRLETELGAAGVAFASRLPSSGGTARIELEGPSPADGTSTRTKTRQVEPGFFDALDINQLVGRRLTVADTGSEVSVVVVNRSFVDTVLGGSAADGRRFRYVRGYREGGIERMPADAEIWHEIVGVVEDFPPRLREPGATPARVYHPVAPGSLYPAAMVVRTNADIPAGFLQRMRDVAASVDPGLRFTRLTTLETSLRELQSGQRLAGLTLALITLSVAALSIAGLYSLMSFAVVRRRREIGIRSALGGQSRSILASIFARVFAQLGAGAALGLVLAVPINNFTGQSLGGLGGAVFLVLVPAAMTLAAVVATLVPARRGLKIEPTEALRE